MMSLKISIFAAIFLFMLVLARYGSEPSAQKPETSEGGHGQYQTATFAGGCFWCVEADFDKLDGVVKAVSGYTGGNLENPTYEQVSSGGTGHLESVEVTFDPARITYAQLLDYFWKHIDPTDADGQFVDRGDRYRSAIFYNSSEQKMLAEQSRRALQGSGRFEKPIVTEIIELKKFYPAEEYHQKYWQKNPLRYSYYRFNSGRDQFLRKVWGEMKASDETSVDRAKYSRPPNAELKKILSPLQYQVARESGTEPPFRNEYWDNKKEGIYVDVVSGEPLFSSLDKYESGTGWPSFTKPLEPGNIIQKEDRSYIFMVRTEVRSKHGDSHLGHVFNDGPPPTGLRYCMNSAALRFIPKEDLKKEGYGEYLKLFPSAEKD